MFLRKSCQRVAPGHGAVFVQDFADHPGQGQFGQTHEFNRRFGMAFAFMDAAGRGPKRENMARAAEITGNGPLSGQLAKGCSAVKSGNSGRYTKPGGGIDADRKTRAMRIGIIGHHLGQVQGIATRRSQSDTDQAARFTGHEIDHFRRREGSRAKQIALILAAFIIGNHDKPAIFQGGKRFIDRIECAGF